AEGRWVARTLDADLAGAGKRIREDPAAASAHLRQLAGEIRQLGDFPDAQRRLLDARRQALLGRLDLARQQGRVLVAGDRFQAAAAAAQQLEKEVSEKAREVGTVPEVTQFRAGYDFLAELARQAGKADSGQ